MRYHTHAYIARVPAHHCWLLVMMGIGEGMVLRWVWVGAGDGTATHRHEHS